MAHFPSPAFLALLSPVVHPSEWKERALLVRSGAWGLDANEIDPRTQHPLLHAFVSTHSLTRLPVLDRVSNDAHEVVQALLDIGARPEAVVEGETALEWCLTQRDWSMANVLEQALPSAVYSVEQEKLLTWAQDGVLECKDKEIESWLENVHAAFGTINPMVKGVPLQWALVQSYLSPAGFVASHYESIVPLAKACAKYGERDTVGLWAVAGWCAGMRDYHSTDDGYHEQSVWEGLHRISTACVDALRGDKGESASWKRLIYHIEKVLTLPCPLDETGQLQWAKTCIGAAAFVEHMSQPPPSPKTGKLPEESPYRAKLGEMGWKLLAQGVERVMALEPGLEPSDLNKLFSKDNPMHNYSEARCVVVEESFLKHRPSSISLWETLAPMSYEEKERGWRPITAAQLVDEVPPPSTHAVMKVLVKRSDEFGRAARAVCLQENLPDASPRQRLRM